MGRSAQHTRNLTDQQLAQQNQLISQSNQQSQQDRAAMMPTITSLLNSPGLHAAAAVRDHAAKHGRGQHRVRRPSPARRESRGRHKQQRRLRRPDRAARPRAGADRCKPGRSRIRSRSPTSN